MVDTPTSATLTLGTVTYGEGDQWAMTQKANGDWITVVNDGVGPDRTIANGTNRLTSALETAGYDKWNHRPFLMTNFDPTNLANPTWNQSVAYNYTNAPEEGISSFYCFGALAGPGDMYLMNIALAQSGSGQRHGDLDYVNPLPVMPRLWFGGHAMAVHQDSTWYWADGVSQASRNWAVALPKPATVLTPFNHNTNPNEPDEFRNGAWTMSTFLQMGPGYSWNQAYPGGQRVQGYVFMYSPRACINEHASPNDTRNRETILSTIWLGTNWDGDSVLKARRAHDNAGEYRVFSGTDGTQESHWDFNMSNANATTVMTWPEIGTSHGQAWYPSVTYVQSHDVFLAIGSSLHLTDYPTRSSRVLVQWAPKPWGPWQVLWDSKFDNGDDVFLQGNAGDRVFSPNWGPIVDVDAETVDLYVCFSSVGPFETQGWTQSVKRRYGMNWSKFRISFSGVTPPPSSELSVSAMTSPPVTLGEGDQWTLTQKLNGDWVTVVNDGRGPYTAIDNTTDRATSNITATFGPRYNHKPFVLSNLDLANLSSPNWTLAEIGYTNPPGTGNPFYCFGALAIGNDKAVLNVALAEASGGGRHDNRSYNDPEPATDWGGQAFAVYQDGSWRYRDGVAHGSRAWGSAMPTAACSLIPGNKSLAGEFFNSAWTLGTFLQMGPGYQWNKDVGWGTGIRGYLFLYSPRRNLDEHATPATGQRQTILARVWVGDDGEADATAKLEHLWLHGEWQVYAGLDGSGVPVWNPDATDANATTVMTWPEAGTHSGQAWYPSVTYVKALDVYLAIGSSLQLPDYPTRASRVVIKWARQPWGPWSDLWDTLTDNGDNFFLQGNSTDRVFSPMWGPIVDVDASTVDCHVCFSGLGDVDPPGSWNTTTKRRYGMNWGKFRITTSGSPPPASGESPQIADSSAVTEREVSGTTISATAPASTQAGDLLIAHLTTSGNGVIATESTFQQRLVATQTSGSQSMEEISTRIATAGDAGKEFTWTTPNGTGTLHIVRVTGHHATNYWDPNSTTDLGNSASPNSPSITTSADNALVFRGLSYASGNITEDTGYPTANGLYYRAASDGSAFHAGGLAWETQAAAGSTGIATWSSGNTSGRAYAASTFAILPGTATTVTTADDTASVIEGGTIDISVLANDTGSSLSVSSVDNGTHGTTQIIGSQVRYTHTGGGVGGQDVFNYTATGSGGSDTATVTVTITAAPSGQQPSAIDPTRPAEGANPAVKADLRANLAAARDEINHGGFHLASGTGALWRRVEDREREFAMLTDYGTDWASFLVALQNNDFIVIPPGANISWEGAFQGEKFHNYDNKTIWGYGARVTITNKFETFGWTNIRWYGVEFVGQSYEWGRLRWADDWLWQDCIWRDFGGSAIYVLGRHPALESAPETAELGHRHTVRDCEFYNIGKDINPDPRPYREEGQQGAQGSAGTVYFPHGVDEAVVENCFMYRSGNHVVHMLGRPGHNRPLSDICVWGNTIIDPMYRGIAIDGSDDLPLGHQGFRIVINLNYVYACGRRQPGPDQLGGEQGSGVGTNCLFIARTAGSMERMIALNYFVLTAENNMEGGGWFYGNLAADSGWRWGELSQGSGGFETARDGSFISGGASIANTYVRSGNVAIRFASSRREDLSPPVNFGDAAYAIVVADNAIIGHNRLWRDIGGPAKPAIDLAVTSLTNPSMQKCVLSKVTLRGVTGQNPSDVGISIVSGSGATIEGTTVVEHNHTYDLLAGTVGDQGVSDDNRTDGST